MEWVLKLKAFIVQGLHIQRPQEHNLLLDQIEQVRAHLEQMQNTFDTLTDHDLIESCIYQMESLEVRYNYLLKQARKQGISVLDKEEKENGALGSLVCAGSAGGGYAVVLQAQQKTG